jgi:hypothetical protein
MMATDIINERSFERVDDDPEGRYARVLDPASYASAEQGATFQSLRVGSSARVPLDVAGGAEQRTQGVVRLQRVQYARSWRVVLGEPQIEGEQSTAVQGGSVPNVAWNVNPALGLIEWGVQGASFQAEVDWGRGCSFVLSADYINVTVQALNLVGTPSTPNPAVAIFPASIAACDSASAPTRPPTRTVFSGVIVPAASVQIKIPAFAKSVRLVRVLSATPNENAEVTFFADAAAAQVVGFAAIGGGSLGSWQESTWQPTLPPQAILMNIRNGPGTVNNASWMAIFELEIN